MLLPLYVCVYGYTKCKCFEFPWRWKSFSFGNKVTACPCACWENGIQRHEARHERDSEPGESGEHWILRFVSMGTQKATMNNELRPTRHNKFVVNATSNLMRCDSLGEFVTKSYNTTILFYFNLLATSKKKCFVYLFIVWATLMASCSV